MSARVRRTSATSRGMRWSGAWRMSRSASPTASSARVHERSVSCPAQPSTRVRWASGRCSSGSPMRLRKTSRRLASSASPSTRGSRPAPHRVGHGLEGGTRVGGDHGVEQGIDLVAPVEHPAGGHDLVERREGVAGGPPADLQHVVDGFGVGVEPGVVDDPLHVLGQLVEGQQVELEVLGAAADGGQHLVRVGGGEHEHHVRRRLLERLQQRVRRRGRQHVDLVEDVHLGATRRAQRRLADEVAHGVDAVVAGRVELLQVVRGARLDGQARVAHAAGLALLQVGAVERLGEDAGGRRLARAAWAAEQVGVADALLAHRVPQRPHHVGLAAHLGEAARPVAAVERLVSHRTRTLPTRDNVGTRPRKWRPGDLRHTAGSAESCCLPALTRFTGCSRTGPGRHIRGRVRGHDSVSLPVAVPAATSVTRRGARAA